MNETEIFNFIFRGTAEFGDVQAELANLLVIEEKLKVSALETQAASKRAATEKKQAAEEARQAAITEINAVLGVQNAIKGEIGLIEKQRNDLKLLKSAREQSNNVADIQKYNSAIKAGQENLNLLTGATDKFKGSNGFWREMSGYVALAFSVSQITEWVGKIFTAQSAVEGFQLSLKRLVGENQAKVIEQQLKTLIVDTPLGFENATKGVERLIFAYQNAGVSTKNIVKDFEAFGNVAKGNDENLKGIVKALDDVANQGKLTGQEILQFGNAGVNIIGLLAESTGKTRAEIKKMQADGTLSFDLVREAIIKAGSEGGKFAGAMSVAMTTVSGRFAQYKDAVFFAMANVGNYFADSAKKTVTWATSVVQALFGTESATRKTIEAFKIAAEVLGIYVLALKSTEIWTKAVAVAETAWLVVQKATTIIRGELILLTRQQAIANNTLSLSQQEAALSAMVLNEALIANPWGAIIALVGTAIVAYQTYNAIAESSAEEQNKLNKSIAEGVAPLKLEQVEFNRLTKEVLDTNLATNQRNKALDELKKKYPDQFDGINNLKDAETKLGVVIRDVNADFIVRQKLLENEIRQNVFREKATTLIKEQIELEGKLLTATKNRVTFGTMDGKTVTYASEYENYQNQIKAKKDAVDKILQQNARLGIDAEDLTRKLKYQYEQDTKNAVNAATATGDKVKKIKADSAATQALIAEKTRITELEKSEVQEQKLLAIDKDIAIQRIKDSTKKAQEKASEIYKIEEKFKQDLNKLTQKYDAIEDKELEKSEKSRLEFRKANNKALNKIEVDANQDMFQQIQEFASLKTDADKRNYVAWLKANKKYLDDGIELDKKNAKEIIKLNEDKYELVAKLRLLDKLSHAKTAEEIVKIEKEEKQKQLEENVEYYRNIKILAELKLARMKIQYGEESNEYKAQKGVTLQAEQDFTIAWEKLIEGRTEKTKEEVEKQEKLLKDSLSIVNELANSIFSIFEKQIQKESDGTTDLVKKARAENAKQFIEIEKGLLSAVSSLATGDIVGAVTKGVGVLFNAIDYAINERQRIAEAKLAKETAKLQAYIDKTKEQVDGILSTYERIEAVYGSKTPLVPTTGYQDLDKAIEIEVRRGEEIVKNYETAISTENDRYERETENIKNKYDGLKADEDNYNQTVLSNIDKAYSEAVSKENDAHQKALENINNEFDLEIKRINDKYDLIDQKATQQYNKETLGILASGSTQLEALIKNEQSLDSVRTEFAAKRQYIIETFALANKQLTADSTQAEIDAVNAAIAARDSALAELQGWYNDELTLIITAEGQKRKEYTETEKVQNQIQDNLDKAALKFQADEIERAQKRGEEIALAEKEKNDKIAVEIGTHNDKLAGLEAVKNSKIETEAARHSAALIDIEDKRQYALLTSWDFHNKETVRLAEEKDKAIAESFTKLKDLIIAQIAQIQIAMNNAINTNIDEYIKLQGILSGVLELYRAITGEEAKTEYPSRGGTGTNPNPATPPRNTPGRALGVERVPRLSGKQGVDTELTYLDAGERVLTTFDNNRLKSKFGKDITNKQLVSMALNQFDFQGIANAGKNVSATDPRLIVNAINGLGEKMSNLKQVDVSIKNGMPTLSERTSNRMIKNTIL